MSPEEIKLWYANWCRQTKRNGGILIGSSIQELLNAFGNKLELCLQLTDNPNITFIDGLDKSE